MKGLIRNKKNGGYQALRIGTEEILRSCLVLETSHRFEIFLVTFGHFLQNGHWIY